MYEYDTFSQIRTFPLQKTSSTVKGFLVKTSSAPEQNEDEIDEEEMEGGSDG
jgi:hypothetical protein